MRNSRLVAIVAVILMLGFALPTLCFALVAGDITAGDSTMPGGCHGQHRPMPMPSHSCCYASHQVPQAVQIAPTPVQNEVVELIDVPAAGESHRAAIVPHKVPDSSPPVPSILRI
jgi:hypothetical protein